MIERRENDGDADSVSATVEAEELLKDLQARANSLLNDLKAFQSCLQDHGKTKDVEIRVFRRSVESEVKSLQTISKQQKRTDDGNNSDDQDLDERTSKYIHALRSSNLPFYEAVWYTARQCKAITALGKKMYWSSQKADLAIERPSSQLNGMHSIVKDAKRSVAVDIVADDGLEWIKVSTITDKRLLFDMAKEGWEGYGDESEDDMEQSSQGDGVDDVPKLEIVQLAQDLYTASRAHRVSFRHPKVQFILPKIREGHTKEIDAVLTDIRATGVTVMCATDTGKSAIDQKLNDLSICADAEDLTYLLPSSTSTGLTPAINVDCTILLALISDISHIRRADLPPSPTNQSGHYHTAILRQIESEESSPLLPNGLYPILEGRKLVCTSHAAQRMREIVEIMGTKSEAERAALFLQEAQYTNTTTDELKHVLQKVSCHPVPNDLNLPIEIVEFDTLPPTKQSDSINATASTNTPQTFDLKIARRLLQHTHTQKLRKPIKSPSSTTPTLPKSHKRSSRSKLQPSLEPPTFTLSPINESVFLYGWSTDTVTITSNRVVAVQILKCVGWILDVVEKEREVKLKNGEEVRGEGEEELEKSFVGPRIHICDTARSLVGKEKLGRGRGDI